MEKQTDLEAKYQKLATEYSKVRSQASILKKAVLDEQSKSSELKDVIRKYEQTIRKHDQEMESLTFRNEQLTKRISVLQQELQTTGSGKKGKQKVVENHPTVDFGVLDEEFQKKILENAQLLSSVADKDIEITNYKERIEWLEERILDLEKESTSANEIYRDKLEKLQKENHLLTDRIKAVTEESKEKGSLTQNDEQISLWKYEVDKLKQECDLLRSKPTSNDQLTEYYESQLRDLLNAKVMALSHTQSLLAEKRALESRLENIIIEYTEVQKKLDRSSEELITTNKNYKSQLDAMTEHLAAQNEKITQQCDEIQLLKHKLSAKK